MTKELILGLVADFSLFIGLIGIAVIIVGAMRGLYGYIFLHESNFHRVRLILGTHLVLGLDFLVGKDIIDTILLDTGEAFWEDLASLITVVIIRIVLTHFMLKEIHEIQEIEAKHEHIVGKHKKAK